jgi:hypothetical protein
MPTQDEIKDMIRQAESIINDKTQPLFLRNMQLVQRRMLTDLLEGNSEEDTKEQKEVPDVASESEAHAKVRRVMQKPPGERVKAIEAELRSPQGLPIDPSITSDIAARLSELSSALDSDMDSNGFAPLFGACNRAQVSWCDSQRMTDLGGSSGAFSMARPKTRRSIQPSTAPGSAHSEVPTSVAFTDVAKNLDGE